MRSSQPQAGVPGVTAHLHSLDALRGLAALAVVFWHWQNFFFKGTTPAAFNRGDQPLFAVFAPLYKDGFLAVNLFLPLGLCLLLALL